MPNINANIAGKIVSIEGTPQIICGNSDYTIRFTFDSEWSLLQKKYARFIFDHRTVDIEFMGNTVDVPIISNADEVKVGVYQGSIKTTTSATIKCRKSIICEGGFPSQL